MCFTAPSWEYVLVLVMGAVLAPGKRTVSACLRMTGRAGAKNFSSYHQLLNRARWNPTSWRGTCWAWSSTASCRMVRWSSGWTTPSNAGGDAGSRRAASTAIPSAPATHGHGHFVKASGLRWLSFMVLTPVPWAGVVKALPVFTLLAPSQRSNLQRGRRHKLLTDWARQGALQLCRWLPGRDIVFVGDSSFAVHDLAHALDGRATLISRLLLDANLFAPPPERHARAVGRPAHKGAPLPKLKTLLSDPATPWHTITVSSRSWPQARQDARDHLKHRTVVSPRHAARTNPLGACQRPRGQANSAGVFQHRHRPRACRHHRTLRPPLAGRSHLCRNPRPSRRRNPTAMVRQGNRANNTRLARPLQPYIAVGLRSPEHYQHALCRSMVSQNQPHLHRRHRLRAPRPVGRRYFPTLSVKPKTTGNPARPTRAHG